MPHKSPIGFFTQLVDFCCAHGIQNLGGGVNTYMNILQFAAKAGYQMYFQSELTGGWRGVLNFSGRRVKYSTDSDYEVVYVDLVKAFMDDVKLNLGLEHRFPKNLIEKNNGRGNTFPIGGEDSIPRRYGGRYPHLRMNAPQTVRSRGTQNIRRAERHYSAEDFVNDEQHNVPAPNEVLGAWIQRQRSEDIVEGEQIIPDNITRERDRDLYETLGVVEGLSIQAIGELIDLRDRLTTAVSTRAGQDVISSIISMMVSYQRRGILLSSTIQRLVNEAYASVAIHNSGEFSIDELTPPLIISSGRI